ncbi:carbohydrate ABC transporter permease [Pelomonas sp. KK5]|uniref:carbohydrate ABC transporter permease n=1 Tax=Pelomonas sp. KK5 TaxID=1855730 RepID=UPI00097C1D58|nr:carbohydrate ABC transporter permease [Pelomonas sp. KK5]
MKSIAVNVVLALAALLAISPLLWMVSVSLMRPGEASNYPPPLLPAEPSLARYTELLKTGGFGRAFLTSLGLASAVTIISTLLNALAGYGFAKLQFAGRDRLFALLLGALVIPGQVGMLPLFLMLKGLGLVNTWAGVIVPSMASIFGIFLVRQYALGLPGELIEAGRLDGASEWRIFVSIVLPLMKPVLVTLAVLTFLGNWNDFMWPLIVLTDGRLYTLPIALAALAREHVVDVEMMMAGAVITVAPVLLLFLALQRYYMQGLLMGGVKQ